MQICITVKSLYCLLVGVYMMFFRNPQTLLQDFSCAVVLQNHMQWKLNAWQIVEGLLGMIHFIMDIDYLCMLSLCWLARSGGYIFCRELCFDVPLSLIAIISADEQERNCFWALGNQMDLTRLLVDGSYDSVVALHALQHTCNKWVWCKWQLGFYCCSVHS